MATYRVMAARLMPFLLACGCQTADEAGHPPPTDPRAEPVEAVTDLTAASPVPLATSDHKTRIRTPEGKLLGWGASEMDVFPDGCEPTPRPTAYVKWHTHAGFDPGGTEIQLAEYRRVTDPETAGALGGEFVFPRPPGSIYRVVAYGPTNAMQPLSAGSVSAVVQDGEIRGKLTTHEGPGDLELAGYIEVHCSTCQNDMLNDDPTFSSDFCKPFAYLSKPKPGWRAR